MSSRRSVAIIELGLNPLKFKFYYICCKRRAMNPSIRKILKRHPESKVIYMQKYVSADCKLLDALKRDKLRSRLNYFDFSLGSVELIGKIRKLSETCANSVVTNLTHSKESYVLDSVIPPNKE